MGCEDYSKRATNCTSFGVKQHGKHVGDVKIYASGFAFEIEVMGSLLALNAVIIGIQVDAWLTAFSTPGGPRGSDPYPLKTEI